MVVNRHFIFYYCCIIHFSVHCTAALFVSGSRNKGQDADPDHGVAQWGWPAGHTCRVQEDVWQIPLLRYHCKTWTPYLPCHDSPCASKTLLLELTAVTCTECGWLCWIAAFARSMRPEGERIESPWVCLGVRGTRDVEEANSRESKGKLVQRGFWDPSILISLYGLVGPT